MSLEMKNKINFMKSVIKLSVRSAKKNYIGMQIEERGRIWLETTKDHSKDAKIMKNIIRIIKEHENFIAQYHLKRGNPLSLKIYTRDGSLADRYEEKVEYYLASRDRRSFTGFPTQENLAKLFDCSKRSIYNWLKELEESPNDFKVSSSSARRLYAIFKSNNFPLMIKNILTATISHSGILRQEFSTVILNIINKYKDGKGIVSEWRLGEQLYENGDSAFHSMKWNFGKSSRSEYNAIFGFLTRVLCLKKESLGIESDNCMIEMREEMKDKAFEFMTRNGYFGFTKFSEIFGVKVVRDKSKVFKQHRKIFDIIINTLIALTKV